MASALIRLDVDPATKKRTIVISYESDSDALPHEHEEAHRLLVEKLLEKGIAKAGDAIRVEREQPKPVETEQQALPAEEPVREAARSGR